MSTPRRRPTAILTISSSRRKPKDEIGVAQSLLPLCLNVDASSLALS